MELERGLARRRGGTFMLAFPAIMAAAFSGFYLALWMVLWTFILRGISLEVGGHLPDWMWRAGGISSSRRPTCCSRCCSVPHSATSSAASRSTRRGKFSMSLFTDFGVRGQVGILDWYTISVAVFTTILLAAHGATYLRLKTEGPSMSGASASRASSGLRQRAVAVVSVETGSCAPSFSWHGGAAAGLAGSRPVVGGPGRCAADFAVLASSAPLRAPAR